MNFRTGIRIFFLIMIFTLLFTGNIQHWGPLLGIGLLVVPFFGRIYCGWVCPVSTTIDILKPLTRKPLFNPSKKYLPNILVQILVVGFSLWLLKTLITINFAVPLFILLIPVGAIITLMFGEVFWHRYCFIGIVYSWLGKITRIGYFTNHETCIGCNSCIDICPNGCISDSHEIDKKNCLSCNKCRDTCPVNTIQFGNGKRLTG